MNPKAITAYEFDQYICTFVRTWFVCIFCVFLLCVC